MARAPRPKHTSVTFFDLRVLSRNVNLTNRDARSAPWKAVRAGREMTEGIVLVILDASFRSCDNRKPAVRLRCVCLFQMGPTVNYSELSVVALVMRASPVGQPPRALHFDKMFPSRWMAPIPPPLEEMFLVALTMRQRRIRGDNARMMSSWDYRAGMSFVLTRTPLGLFFFFFR